MQGRLTVVFFKQFNKSLLSDILSLTKHGQFVIMITLKFSEKNMTYIIIALCGAVLLFLISMIICFLFVFYSAPKKELPEGEYDLPEGKIYEPHYDEMRSWVDQVRAMGGEEMKITSFDGLTLYGKYYEYSPDAPLEILFHGYRGNALRDLCGAVERCFAIGRSALIVDQRGSGKSGGRLITFGVRERFDCLSWVNFANERFGKDKKIILTGISMGASTVMMASGEELPENVVCILADCGYSSAEAIIKKVMRQLHMPVSVFYPIVKLGARVFGRFDLEEAPPIEAVKKCKVPMIFIHGENDDFVPCDMSRELFEACASKKKIMTVPNAGHGLAFPIDKDGYLTALRDFENEAGFLLDNK